jgi:hypothetical protein
MLTVLGRSALASRMARCYHVDHSQHADFGKRQLSHKAVCVCMKMLSVHA